MVDRRHGSCVGPVHRCAECPAGAVVENSAPLERLDTDDFDDPSGSGGVAPVTEEPANPQSYVDAADGKREEAKPSDEDNDVPFEDLLHAWTEVPKH